jgi:hypothetical protein
MGFSMMTGEELRAHLLAEAGKAIDKVLAERPAADKITLRDIERLAVQAGTCQIADDNGSPATPVEMLADVRQHRAM